MSPTRVGATSGREQKVEQPFYHRWVAAPDQLTRVWIGAEASLPVGWRVS